MKITKPKFKIGELARLKHSYGGNKDSIKFEQRLSIISIMLELCPGGQQNHYTGRVFRYLSGKEYGKEVEEQSSTNRQDKFNEIELEAIDKGGK